MQPRLVATIMTVVGVALAPVAHAGGPLLFSEVAAEAGVVFDYAREPYIPIGAGGTWLDYDGDGWLDLYLVQGRGDNALFRNLGDGRFEPVDGAAGAADADRLGHGAVAADYDNDGDTDLFVTNHGEDRLFRNQRVETGVAEFVDVTDAAGLGHAGAFNSSSAAWGDYDGDGWLDLYVGTHLGEFRVRPAPHLATANYLWHNRGDGTFDNVAKRLGVDVGAANVRDGSFTEPGATLAVQWSDYDDDGDADLLVINDFGDTIQPNQLFRNDGPDGDGGWLFTDVGARAGFDVRILGMGIAVGDVDNDGDLDYYASNGGDNVLLLNRLETGEARFDEAAAAAGVLANDPETYGPAMGPISWGVDFADLDLDGWLDLLVVNGWIEHADGLSEPLQPTTYLFRNLGDATFEEVGATAGLHDDALSGKASGFADFDRDGDVDFFVGSAFLWDPIAEEASPAPIRLFRNDTERGTDRHWLTVAAIGSVGARDALGARIELRSASGERIREVGTARSFLSSGELAQHFGLGADTRVDELRVRFPSGIVVTERDLEVDRRIDIVEPTLTVSGRADREVVAIGGTILLEVGASDHLGEDRTVDVWIDRIDSEGRVFNLRRQDGLTVRADSPIEAVVEIPVGADFPLGEVALVVRAGTYRTTVVHQAFCDVVVVE